LPSSKTEWRFPTQLELDESIFVFSGPEKEFVDVDAYRHWPFNQVYFLTQPKLVHRTLNGLGDVYRRGWLALKRGETKRTATATTATATARRRLPSVGRAPDGRLQL